MSVSRSIAINTVGKLIPPVLALATQPLLALGLGVSGRGELAAATAPLMLVTAILTFGVPDAFTHYIARRVGGARQLVRRGFIVLALAGVLGSGIVAALAPVLAQDEEGLAALITIAGAGIIPSLLVSGLRGIAAGHHLWHRIAFERILGAVLRFIGVLVLFLPGLLTPLTATIVFAVTNFLSGVVFLWPRRGAASAAPLPEASGERVSVVSYGFRIWLGTAAGALMARVDQVVMTPLSTLEQLGLYAVAASVSEVALVFNTAIREVLFSAESESPQERRIALASRLSTLITFTIALGIAVVSPWAFPLLFGEGFAAGVPVLWVLLLAVVLGNPGSVAGVALSSRGKPELRSAALAIAVTVNVVLVALLAAPFGALGVAFATLAGNVVAGNLCMVFLRRRFGVPIRSFYAFQVNDLRELRVMLNNLLRRKATP